MLIKPQNGANQGAPGVVRGTVVSVNSEAGEVTVVVNGSKDKKEILYTKEQKRLIPCVWDP